MTEAKHENHEAFICDICKAEGVKAVFKAPTALGMHKRLKHGIIGQSKASQNYREAKAKAAKVAINPELEAKRAKWRADAKLYRDRKLAARDESRADIQEKLAYNKRFANRQAKHELVAINKGAYSNGEAIALITVGRIQAICEAEAEKHNISRESFTKRCSELFFASQIRQ